MQDDSGQARLAHQGRKNAERERAIKLRHVASLLGIGAALMLTLGVVTASAATTIGQTSTSTNYACQSEFDLQTGVTSGASFVVPPGSWLLTSWSTYAGLGLSNTGGGMSLMIFRPAAVPGSYTVVAESPFQLLKANVLNTFPANIVVQGGDLLGFWAGGNAACATNTGSPGDVNPFVFGSEPAVGATVTPSVALGFLLNISATISSPADLIARLLTDVTGQGPGTSLADKVTLVQGSVAASNNAAACSTLTDFTSEVNAQNGKMLTAAQASSFTAQATDIEATLGC
jgi:hypothetical protein